MSNCMCCDTPIGKRQHQIGTEGPFCWLCYEVKLSNQQRKATAMNSATITATEDEAIQAIVDRKALRIPTTNNVVFAGRITRPPLVMGNDTSMIAVFQVANEDPDHPSETEVCMKGPGAEFCRTLRKGQAVVINGRIDSRVISVNCLVTRIAATFIEPLQ